MIHFLYHVSVGSISLSKLATAAAQQSCKALQAGFATNGPLTCSGTSTAVASGFAGGRRRVLLADEIGITGTLRTSILVVGFPTRFMPEADKQRAMQIVVDQVLSSQEAMLQVLTAAAVTASEADVQAAAQRAPGSVLDAQYTVTDYSSPPPPQPPPVPPTGNAPVIGGKLHRATSVLGCVPLRLVSCLTRAMTHSDSDHGSQLNAAVAELRAVAW